MPQKREKRGGLGESVSSALYTIAFSILMILTAIFLPITAFIWPIWTAIELGDMKYLRHYPRYFIRGIEYAYAHIKLKGFVRTCYDAIFRHNVLLSKEYIEKQLKKRRGECIRCGKCCKMLKCPLLEWDSKGKKWKCAAYGHPFWEHVYCSKYPLNQEDIDMYGCPAFWFEE